MGVSNPKTNPQCEPASQINEQEYYTQSSSLSLDGRTEIWYNITSIWPFFCNDMVILPEIDRLSCLDKREAETYSPLGYQNQCLEKRIHSMLSQPV